MYKAVELSMLPVCLPGSFWMAVRMLCPLTLKPSKNYPLFGSSAEQSRTPPEELTSTRDYAVSLFLSAICRCSFDLLNLRPAFVLLQRLHSSHRSHNCARYNHVDFNGQSRGTVTPNRENGETSTKRRLPTPGISCRTTPAHPTGAHCVCARK